MPTDVNNTSSTGKDHTDESPNHHLWNNRGVWWCHVTVHKPDSTAERLRFSLKTRDIEKARARRDKIFASIQQHFGIAA